MASFDDYLLGTDDTEAVRLGIQHRLWADDAHAIWARAGIVPGSRVLDVGSGPGYAAMDLAELVGPRGRVLGVEGSPAYAEIFNDRARARGFTHTEVRVGDAHHLGDILGPDRGSFDAAYIRWVLCFSTDPGAIIRGVFDTLAPGGRIAIQDYFGYAGIRLAPESEAFQRGIEGVVDSWASNGDLNVMGKVQGLLRGVGFEVESFEVRQRLAKPTNQMWTWPSIFWPSYIPRVVEAGELTQPEADAFLAAWEEASGNPDAFLLLPPIFEAVAVKPG